MFDRINYKMKKKVEKLETFNSRLFLYLLTVDKTTMKYEIKSEKGKQIKVKIQWRFIVPFIFSLKLEESMNLSSSFSLIHLSKRRIFKEKRSSAIFITHLFIYKSTRNYEEQNTDFNFHDKYLNIKVFK